LKGFLLTMQHAGGVKVSLKVRTGIKRKRGEDAGGRHRYFFFYHMNKNKVWLHGTS